MSQAPAGWYSDPTPTPGQPSTQRYWDGQSWTEHVAPVVMSPAPAVGGVMLVATTPDGAPLAGWWWRGLAYLIDAAIVGVAGGLASIPAQIGFQRDIGKLTQDFDQLLSTHPTNPDFAGFFSAMVYIYQRHLVGLVVPSTLISIAYFGLMLRFKGATVGKLACGLRVRRRDADGQLAWSTIMARISVQYLIPILVPALAIAAWSWGSWPPVVAAYTAVFVFGLVNYLWAAADDKKQALHDKAAKTNVIKTR